VSAVGPWLLSKSQIATASSEAWPFAERDDVTCGSSGASWPRLSSVHVEEPRLGLPQRSLVCRGIAQSGAVFGMALHELDASFMSRERRSTDIDGQNAAEHAFSLTQRCTMCSCTLRPRIARFWSHREVLLLNSLQTLRTLTWSVSLLSNKRVVFS
jgi:hypothetical protein